VAIAIAIINPVASATDEQTTEQLCRNAWACSAEGCWRQLRRQRLRDWRQHSPGRLSPLMALFGHSAPRSYGVAQSATSTKLQP